MILQNPTETIGVLISGGIDSCILSAHLVRQGQRVQPFYIQSGLFWEPQERLSVARFLASISAPNLHELVTLELPVDDLYAGHWSLTGVSAPGSDAPDEAVYLPGRNALLVVKAAIWCQLNGIRRLALAPLENNPFADASPAFFGRLQDALSLDPLQQLEIVCPFAEFTKRSVMQMGADLDLELTFSCISPANGIHCGACNKCAERQEAFRSSGLIDRTCYVGKSPATVHEVASTKGQHV